MFKEAIKDCNTVLEIWEFLEDKARKHGNTIVFKVWFIEVFTFKMRLLFATISGMLLWIAGYL